ncbi:MAG: DoxX family protein [bacterium]
MLSLLKKIQSVRAGNLGLLILRLVIGAIFFKAGSGKLFGWFGGFGIEGATNFFQKLGIPAPHFHAIFVGCTELLGGIALILGFLTRLAAIPLGITMIVAILTAHKDGDFYYPLVILAACISLVDVGPGIFSLDRALSSGKSS